MDGPRDYHTKRSKPEKDYCHMKFICGILKNYTNELIYKIYIDSQERKQTFYQRGKEGRCGVG